MNIVLFGMKGVGKTTIGKKLAEKIESAFIDTDSLIEEVYRINRNKKLTCREIYQEGGETTFRALEYEVVQSLQDVQHSVIAVGGSTMLLYENVVALKKQSRLIYLTVDRELLKKRLLAQDPLPTFIDPQNLEASFEKMYDEKESAYEKVGGQKLNVTTLSKGAAVEKIYEMTRDGKQ